MMDRLTRKLGEGFYVAFVPNTDTLKEKLGQLEDLMEQYNINDFDELEKALDYYKNRNNKFIFGFGE